MKRKIKRFFNELRKDPIGYVLDLLAAHRKVVITAVTVLLVRFVDSETADWIVGLLGAVLTGGVPNDQDAIERVYPNLRRHRTR